MRAALTGERATRRLLELFGGVLLLVLGLVAGLLPAADAAPVTASTYGYDLHPIAVGSLGSAEPFGPSDQVGSREGAAGIAATRGYDDPANHAGAIARSDRQGLAPRSVPALRQAYVDDVASIADDVAAWQKAGADPEFIAREAWANRRALGIQYKNLTPAETLTEIHARNLGRYGDPLGPSIEWLRGQGRTWEQIIESATRTGGRDLGF